MSIILGTITLAQRDKYIFQINKDIERKKKELLKKQKELLAKAKLNHFLDNVIDDYSAYYTYIISEKQKQYDALSKLSAYLKKLENVDDKLEDEINVSNYEQQELLREMTKIKEELDEIIAHSSK